MKKQVTVQLTVIIGIEVDVQDDETLTEAVEYITQDMDYSFTAEESGNGRITHTEILEEEIIETTDMTKELR